MEIIVLVKHVVDVELNLRVQNGALVEDGLNYVISGWDEIAIEAALQITENVGGEVTLLTVGPERATDALRKGLAMGAHKAIHILDDATEGSDSLGYARILSKALEGRNFDLIIAGKQAQDTDAGLTPGMLSEFLKIPLVSNVAKLEASEGSLQVHRKGDVGNEVVALQLPALITSNDSLYEPRLASLRGIMQAKKKPIETLSLSDIGVDPSTVGSAGAHVQVIQLSEPESRQAGEVFEGSEDETTPQVVDVLNNKLKLFA